MRRTIFEPEHDTYRESAARFWAEEAVPHFDDWEREGITDRALFVKAAEVGMLAMAVPEQFGGAGEPDFRLNQIVGEEGAMAGVTGPALAITLHNDICLPYFLRYCTDEQRARWLPGIVSGELITAIAMTEPGIGSDLASMSTPAIAMTEPGIGSDLASMSPTAIRDGDHYVVNGAKTFITNGINADLVITAVKTGSNQADRRGGMSLLIIERGMPGFERGRNLDKLGLHSQDTAELSFTDVRVPVENLLGAEGEGFTQLTTKLPQERVSIAVNALAEAVAAFDETVRYVQERTAFGTAIAAFQNTKFVLAEIATELEVAQAYVDRCVDRLNLGQLNAADAAKAKLHCTELQG